MNNYLIINKTFNQLLLYSFPFVVCQHAWRTGLWNAGQYHNTKVSESLRILLIQLLHHSNSLFFELICPAVYLKSLKLGHNLIKIKIILKLTSIDGSKFSV